MSDSEIVDLLIDTNDGLARVGNSILNSILHSERARWLSRWRSSAQFREATPRLEIISNCFFVPWGLLYHDFDLIQSQDKNLDQVMDNFWACSYIIAQRPVPATEAWDVGTTFLVEDSGIPYCPIVGLFANPKLEYARQESLWLENIHRQGLIQLKSFQFDSGIPLDEKRRRINEHLSDPALDIIHFACEANWRQPEMGGPVLEIAPGLTYRSEDFTVDPAVILPNRPIVILNACATGVRSPRQTYDFAQLFGKHGASAVIATETVIKSKTALEFAQALYTRLLSGSFLGEAVFEAREELLSARRSESLLSIFYSLYGNPHIRY